MPGPDSLKELYLDEIKDLWSANEQMVKVLPKLTEGLHDKKLKTMLDESVSGINEHTATLKSLVEEAGGEATPEHCKGMEGLVKEALKHCVAEAPEDPDLKDIMTITQYQRMSHYGITGFGSAAAIAKALGLSKQAKTLHEMVGGIYKSDEYASQIGERLAKLAAKHEKAKAE